MPKIESILTERVLVPLRPEWTIKGGRGTHDRSPFLLIRVRSEGLKDLVRSAALTCGVARVLKPPRLR